MSSWKSFVKIWTVGDFEFNANLLTFFRFILRALCSRNYGSLLNHNGMANIWEKVISILARNLNLGRSHLIITVKVIVCFLAFSLNIWPHYVLVGIKCIPVLVKNVVVHYANRIWCKENTTVSVSNPVLERYQIHKHYFGPSIFFLKHIDFLNGPSQSVLIWHY